LDSWNFFNNPILHHSKTPQAFFYFYLALRKILIKSS